MSFRFRRLQQMGHRIAIRVPTDQEGFLGRECPQPQCEGYFKVKPGTGLRGENLPCVCPYCGHSGPSDHFWTKQQIEYAQSVALRQISDALQDDLKKLEFEHKPRGAFGIGISLKFKPGAPVPIRHYREAALETQITCAGCTLDYAVFGVFAYCPDCSIHNSLQILQKNLDLTGKQLDLAETLTDGDLRRHLIEDALENCISAFDAFGREACRIRSAKSTDPSKCDTISFQHLRRAASRLQILFGIDLPVTVLATEWDRAHLEFMRRHVVAHKAGVIDQPYLNETGEAASLLGRRLAIGADDVRTLADLLRRLGQNLIGLLPPP